MILLTKQPAKFSPAGNPVIYGISADTNFVYFTVELQDAKNNLSLYTDKAYATPDTQTQVYHNLSYPLASLVDSDVDNGASISEGKTKPVFGYKLLITDYGVTGGTVAPLSSGITTDTFYAWDCFTDNLNYTNTNFYNKYVINSGSTNTSFLTYQPDRKQVNDYSFEQLYFLQDGYTGLTAVVTVSGTDTNYPIFGIATNTITTTPAVPETRATGLIRIQSATGATNATVGDNIGIFANGNLLGSYTAPAGVPFTSVAAGLASSLSGNGYGYGISYILNTNYIGVTAPSGLGASGNVTLSGALITSATTGSSITASTRATAVLSGFTLPSSGVTTVDSSHPTLGGVNLAVYTVQPTDTTLSTYTNNLVSAINANPYGFLAERLAAARIRISASTDTGAAMNGGTVFLEDYESFVLYTGTFSGGVTVGTGTTVTTHSIIPNIITGLTGGTNAISAVTTTATTYDVPPMIRLQVSPKKLGLTLNNGDSYSVKVKAGSTVLTEERTFLYKDFPCTYEAVNIAFTNSLGGLDSIQLYNPVLSINTEKQGIKKNNMDLSSPTPFKTGDRYNASQVTINTNTSSSFKAYTKQFVSDAESKHLVELVQSKNHYVELPSGDLLPVQLKNTTFIVQKRRLSKDPVIYQFDFVLDDNYLPMLGDGIVIN